MLARVIVPAWLARELVQNEIVFAAVTMKYRHLSGDSLCSQ
jgi:hypothetical protein